MLTVKQISEELVTDKHYVLNLLHTGLIPYAEIGNKFLVREEDFDRFKEWSVGKQIRNIHDMKRYKKELI